MCVYLFGGFYTCVCEDFEMENRIESVCPELNLTSLILFWVKHSSELLASMCESEGDGQREKDRKEGVWP